MSHSTLGPAGTAATIQDVRQGLADLLADARARTLDLVAPLSVDELFVQQDRLMSPIIWDIGHIGNFEELWGVRKFGRSLRPEYDDLYDAMKNPRATRDKLPLPRYEGVMAYLSEVRAQLLAGLYEADLDGADPLLRAGYVYNMLLQHEYQHNETILATLHLKQGEPYHPGVRIALPPGDVEVGGMITVAAGEFMMGTDDRAAAYDNERDHHRVNLPEYRIGAAPVSNGEFMEFVNAGGYRTREFWDDAGWAFINEHGIEAPKHWRRDEDGVWHTRSMDHVERVNARRPVVHVCWHEAVAYCRFVGMRLPSEAEWEKAAAWDPATGESRRFPWGNNPFEPRHGNLDHLAFMAAEIGAYPEGVSAVGCHQMIGDVWEWTSSDFAPYPGFEAFPYDEYSKVFFGPDYKVLRGGSWATRPGAIRNSFRNWDYPIRRQIFSGFRCAQNA